MTCKISLGFLTQMRNLSNMQLVGRAFVTAMLYNRYRICQLVLFLAKF